MKSAKHLLGFKCAANLTRLLTLSMKCLMHVCMLDQLPVRLTRVL